MKVLVVATARRRVPGERARLHATVQTRVRAKVQLGADLLDANVDAVLHQIQIAPRLHQGDLSRRGPVAVRIRLGHKVDGAADPVPGRHLGVDLHLAVLEGERVDSADPGTLHRIDDGERRASAFAAPQLVVGAAEKEGYRRGFNK